MTIDQCALTAQSLNLQYFGLEYASQCLAGSTINAGSSVIDPKNCNKPCSGNGQQICGGANAISLYRNSLFTPPVSPDPVLVSGQSNIQYKYQGCYTEGTGARALGSTAQQTSSATTNSSLTVEGCAADCYSKDYAWMGVENGNQCFCNAAGIINNAVLSSGGDADCSTTCVGNPREFCGAPSKLNVYHLS